MHVGSFSSFIWIFTATLWRQCSKKIFSSRRAFVRDYLWFLDHIYIYFFFESAWGLLNLCICVVLVCSIHVPAGIFLWLFFLLQIKFVICSDYNMFVVYGKNVCKQWQGPVSDFLTFLETYSPNCSNVGLWMMYYHCHPQAKSWSAILLCQDLYIKDIC